MFSLPEGPSLFFEIANRYKKFSLGSFGASLSESTFWVVLIYGIFINMQNYGIDQNYVQRFMTARNDKEAIINFRRGVAICIGILDSFYDRDWIVCLFPDLP